MTLRTAAWETTCSAKKNPLGADSYSVAIYDSGGLY